MRDTGITLSRFQEIIPCCAWPLPSPSHIEGLRRWVHIDRDRWPRALWEASLPFILVCGCHLDGSLLLENRLRNAGDVVSMDTRLAGICIIQFEEQTVWNNGDLEEHEGT